MDIALAIFSIVWVWICFLMIPFGLPGNWLMAASALLAIYGEEASYTPLILLLSAATIAELFEALLGGKMAQSAGASKAGMVGSFLGALLGGFFLTFLVPIPIVGTVAGACLGAFLGAVLFEALFTERNADSKNLAHIGLAAATGVLFGRLMKVTFGAVGAIYWTIVAVEAYF
ncbi:MAG: DUF456 domain-containing protein [Planctomycetota bacterium]|nr:DUF456 domain-containing protein [Planctomycetota bacterium]